MEAVGPEDPHRRVVAGVHDAGEFARHLLRIDGIGLLEPGLAGEGGLAGLHQRR